MKAAFKKLYEENDFEIITLSQKEFLYVIFTLLLIDALILIQSLWCGMTQLIIILALTPIPLYIRAAKLRLYDQGLKGYWLFLALTGVGVFYLLYLLFIKSGISMENTLSLVDEDNNQVQFVILETLIYDDDKYIVLYKKENEEMPHLLFKDKITILRVKSTNDSFAPADDEITEEIFNDFKERNMDKFLLEEDK